ncbi:MAG: alkaline phosphatase D family protein [Polyangiaceae bacterium]
MGDQIYVDPEPDHVGPDGSTIAAFSGASSSHVNLSTIGREDEYFDVLYRGYLLNEPMNRTLSHLPTAMTWDDHDIRDGWGSHGDEGEPFWQSWYDAAGRHFVAWQLLRGPGSPVSWESHNTDGYCRAFPQFFRSANTRMMVLDERTCRTTTGPAPGVLGGWQLRSLAAWLATPAPNGTTWVLASAAPLFITASSSLRPRNVAFGLANLLSRGEMADDFKDMWGDAAHASEQQAVINLLTERLANNDRDRLLVISGDYHESHLLRIEIDGVVRGYEVISSGVAADRKGKSWLAWMGVDPYTTTLSQSRLLPSKAPRIQASWLGRVTDTPSFAEIFIEPHRVRLAWFSFSDNSNLYNLGPLEEQCCDPTGAPSVSHPVERKADPPSGRHSILVDELEFGMAGGRPVGLGAITHTDLGSSALLQRSPVHADTTVSSLAFSDICEAIANCGSATISGADAVAPAAP